MVEAIAAIQVWHLDLPWLAMSPRREPFWAQYSDQHLLDLRLCDLKVSLEGTMVERCLMRLHGELAARGLKHRPHAWVSNEWFSPDGIPGIAVPFYLCHPRLIRLERKMMLQVEGGQPNDCMKIMRHETGHTVCSAYRLHRRAAWRKAFGSVTEPYPDEYRPVTHSRAYVQHLDWWYAQAHPTEDFAETFAVWLTPRSRWRQRYLGWPALKKLHAVDEMLTELAGVAPPVHSRRRVDPMSQFRITLREHYERKRYKYAEDWPDFYDVDLRRIFSDAIEHVKRPTASSFLRRNQTEVREAVSLWTGGHPYAVDQVLHDMIDRCRELKLRLVQGEAEAKAQTILMVAVQTARFLHGGAGRFAL